MACARAWACRTFASAACRANTHFAQVMIEADYRMKLIGIGLERPPVKLASYVDKANPAMVEPQRACSAGTSFPTTSACA